MKLLSYFTHHLLITHTNYNRIPYHVQFSFCDKISLNFQFPWLALECRDLDQRTKKQTRNLVRVTEVSKLVQNLEEPRIIIIFFLK